jgi:hypothetical protein
MWRIGLRLWKHVTKVQIHTKGEINSHSKIECYFTLFYIFHLHLSAHHLLIKFIGLASLWKKSYTPLKPRVTSRAVSRDLLAR